MTADLRARLVAALEDCRVLTPDAQADAVMAVLGEAARAPWWPFPSWEAAIANARQLEAMAPDYWLRVGNEVIAGEQLTGIFAKTAAHLEAKASGAAALQALMVAAEKLALDWPNPGTPEHRQAVTRAVNEVEARFADILAAGAAARNNAS